MKFSTFAEGMAHGGVGASGKVSGRYTDKNLGEIFLIFVTKIWKGLSGDERIILREEMPEC